MKIFGRVFITAFLVGYPLVCASGQETESWRVQLESKGPTNCAASNMILDVLTQGTGLDELIIVIARPGSKETRHGIVRRRLHNIRTYLTEYLTHEDVRRKPETIILAEGEKVEGYGRIEFYTRGKLFDYLNVRRDDDLILGTCYPDDVEKGPCALESDKNFYPCRDRYTSRPKTRSRRR